MPNNKNNDLNERLDSINSRIDNVNKWIDDTRGQLSKKIDNTADQLSNKMTRQYNLLSSQNIDLVNSNKEEKSNTRQTVIISSILLGFIAVATAIVK